jgi:hypothetical protein
MMLRATAPHQIGDGTGLRGSRTTEINLEGEVELAGF